MSADDPELDAAIAVFRTHGFVGASIQKLVDATGLSRSSLYNRYGDKDGLFVACLTRYVETGTDDMDAPCLLTRSCSELADLPTDAADVLATALEEQWTGFIDNAGTTRRAEAQGTLALAVHHGLRTLAAAGVPADTIDRARTEFTRKGR